MLRRYIINNYGVAPPKNVKTVLKHFASVHFSSTTTTGGDDGDGEDNNNNNNNSDSEDNNNINDDDDVGTTIDTTQESVTGVARRGFEPLNTLKILKTASKAVANTIDVGLDVDVKGASAIANTTAEIALASPVSASFAANPKRPRTSPF